jgi:hypothetical protein
MSPGLTLVRRFAAKLAGNPENSNQDIRDQRSAVRLRPSIPVREVGANDRNAHQDSPMSGMPRTTAIRRHLPLPYSNLNEDVGSKHGAVVAMRNPDSTGFNLGIGLVAAGRAVMAVFAVVATAGPDDVWRPRWPTALPT